MCAVCSSPEPALPPRPGAAVSRRVVLTGLGAAVVASGLSWGAQDAPAWADGPDPALLTRDPVIRPREAWAGAACPVRGPLPVEAPGDVTFLLVHHTDVPGNDYAPAEVAGKLRGMYAYHVGPDKRWPDLAYNFLVDRYGGIWEGRAGSLIAPVVPGATGGTQGYDQLGCFLGNHSTVPPTPQAQASMISLLAWLARRYAVDTSPGATTSFVSRGSNRWPAGTRVTTRTIEGHRAMSLTSCPGDAAYPLVLDVFPAAVTQLNEGGSSGGAIDAKHASLGGDAGFLGAAASEELDVPGGRVRHYAGGDVLWSRATGAHVVYGAILVAYGQAGGSGSPLGMPTSDEVDAPRGGRASSMRGGAVLWSPVTGAHAVQGSIWLRYLELGGAAGPLGLPVSGEEAVPGGRRSRFSGGDLYWSPATGVREVHGSIRECYDAVGGAGTLGVPVSDELVELHGRRSDLARGRVYWSPATGARPVLGGILARYLAGGGAATYGFPLTGEVPDPGLVRQDFERALFEYDLRTGRTTIRLH